MSEVMTMVKEGKPCTRCGSMSPRRKQDDAGLCLNTSGCEARRCRRRVEDDLKRFKGKRWVQCHATKGSTSISFCELGEGHEGLHQRGTVQWGGREQHPLAALIRAFPI